MTTDTTQGALDQMVAGIMGAKLEAAKGLRSLPSEDIRAQERVGIDTTSLMRQYDVCVAELARLRSMIQALDGKDGLDRTLETLDWKWTCLLHPTAGAVNKAVDGQTFAKCAKPGCNEWDRPDDEEPGPGFYVAGPDSESTIAERWPTKGDLIQIIPPKPDHWLCPDHQVAEQRTSRKGRQFYACTQCTEFER